MASSGLNAGNEVICPRVWNTAEFPPPGRAYIFSVNDAYRFKSHVHRFLYFLSCIFGVYFDHTLCSTKSMQLDLGRTCVKIIATPSRFGGKHQQGY